MLIRYKLCRVSRFFCFRSFSSVENSERTVVERATKIWIDEFVVPNNLCPWAKSANAENKIKIIALPRKGKNLEELDYLEDTLKKVSEEALLLMKDDDFAVNEINLKSENKEIVKQIKQENLSPIAYESTLIVVPEFKEFDDFLNFTDLMEELFDENEVSLHVQCSYFHPKFMYHNTLLTDASNFVNRSPFPTIQIMRVSDVTQAISRYEESLSGCGDNNASTIIESISLRNEQTMNSKSCEYWTKNLVGIVKKSLEKKKSVKS